MGTHRFELPTAPIVERIGEDNHRNVGAYKSLSANSLAPDKNRCRQNHFTGSVSETTTVAAETVTAVQAEQAQTPVAIAVAEATGEVMAETAEAVSETTTMAAEIVAAVQGEVAQTPVVIEMAKPSTKPTLEEKPKSPVEKFVAFSEGNLTWKCS